MECSCRQNCYRLDSGYLIGYFDNSLQYHRYGMFELMQGIYWSRISGFIPKFGIFPNLARNCPDFRDNCKKLQFLAQKLGSKVKNHKFWTAWRSFKLQKSKSLRILSGIQWNIRCYRDPDTDPGTDPAKKGQIHGSGSKNVTDFSQFFPDFFLNYCPYDKSVPNLSRIRDNFLLNKDPV